MSTRTITLLHPGEMGAAIGVCAVANGARVYWVPAGRSAATSTRAAASGLIERSTLVEALRESDTLLSVCPPGAAVDVAHSVAATGFKGLYVDANAIAPATTRKIGEIVAANGALFVDGGIIGTPPAPNNRTILYLAGDAQSRVAELFANTPLQVIGLDKPIGSASALKACYAAWTKGTSALIADVLALAEHEDIDAELEAEFAISQPDLKRTTQRMAGNARKAWRWVAEMEEIAASFAAAGLPDGFHRAAADVYSRLENFKDAHDTPNVRAITSALRTRKAQ